MNSYRPLVIAGILLGLGLGGFFDGIVLHQILQWHHMVIERFPATTLENLEINTLADGIFHIVTYALTAVGLYQLWRVVTRQTRVLSGTVLIGSMLVGWGIFNTFDSVVNHWLLELHHIKPGPDEAFWDIAFLVWGLAMLAGGWLMIRAATREPAEARNS